MEKSELIKLCKDVEAHDLENPAISWQYWAYMGAGGTRSGYNSNYNFGVSQVSISVSYHYADYGESVYIHGDVPKEWEDGNIETFLQDLEGGEKYALAIIECFHEFLGETDPVQED